MPHPDGIELATSDPLTRAGLLLLGRRWPESIPFDELAEQALRESEKSLRALYGNLLEGMLKVA